MAQVVDRRQAVVGNLVDVEGELSLDMLVFAFGIVHHRPVARAQFWKLHGYREIRRLGVTDGIADVVRKRAHRKRQFVRVAGVAKQVDDKVAGAHIVRQVRKKLVAKRIVADVLDDAAAVGIGAGVLQLLGSQGRIAAQQQGERCRLSRSDRSALRGLKQSRQRQACTDSS